MSDLGNWYWDVPRFTRLWFTSTVVLTLLGRFSLVNPINLVLLYEPIIRKWQVWRLVTSVLYYPLSPQTGFHFLINLYFLYNYSRRLEEGHYHRKPADFLYLLFFNLTCCVIFGLATELPLLMDPMVLSVLYIWCQLNKDVIVSFWFGTRFKALYLPWVLLGFNLVMSGGGMMELIGILIGHLYFFLAYKYPQELGGPALLATPGFLKNWFPDESGINGIDGGFGQAPNRAVPPRWMGRGYVLGGGGGPTM